MDSCRLYHLLLWSRQTWHLPIHTLLFLSSLPASDSNKLAHCMAGSSCKVQWWWPPCQPWTLVRVLQCIKMGLLTGGQLTLAPLLSPLWWGCIFTTAPRTLLSAACSVSHLDIMWLRKFVLMPPRHAVSTLYHTALWSTLIHVSGQTLGICLEIAIRSHWRLSMVIFVSVLHFYSENLFSLVSIN